ncbi:MAG: hypothetical protein FJ149_06370 [Euryarchaeota archaeon]|nr:hypothetical protein [Euryarchaeota archaeon]
MADRKAEPQPCAEAKKFLRTMFLIGIGQCGGNVVARMMKWLHEIPDSYINSMMKDAIGDRYLAINSGPELKFLPMNLFKPRADGSRDHSVAIGDERGSSFVKKGRLVHRDNWSKIEASIQTLLPRDGSPPPNLFIVVNSVGGGTGSGGAPFVIEKLRELYPESFIWNLAFLPHELHGKGKVHVPHYLVEMDRLIAERGLNVRRDRPAPGKGDPRSCEDELQECKITPIMVSNLRLRKGRCEGPLCNVNTSDEAIIDNFNLIGVSLIDSLLFPLLLAGMASEVLGRNRLDEWSREAGMDLTKMGKMSDLTDISRLMHFVVPLVLEGFSEEDLDILQSRGDAGKLESKFEECLRHAISELSYTLDENGRPFLRGTLAGLSERPSASNVLGLVSGDETFANGTAADALASAVNRVFAPNFLECTWYRRPDDKKVLLLLGGADVSDFRMWAAELGRLLERRLDETELLRNINFSSRELRAVHEALTGTILPKRDQAPAEAGQGQAKK